MLRMLAIFLAVTFLSAPAGAAENSGPLQARYDQFKAALAKRAPMASLRSFFSPEFIHERQSVFSSYEFLDGLVQKPEGSAEFVEKIKGNRGCLAHAKPYKADSPGWVELSTYTFQRNNGQWVITDASWSISDVHNVVKSRNYCLTLGWPWPQT